MLVKEKKNVTATARVLPPPCCMPHTPHNTAPPAQEGYEILVAIPSFQSCRHRFVTLPASLPFSIVPLSLSFSAAAAAT
jgi:hypothetical protein